MYSECTAASQIGWVHDFIKIILISYCMINNDIHPVECCHLWVWVVAFLHLRQECSFLGALRPTGGCVQSWVAHHGVRGGAPEENFASKTIFRTKNAYSEDVKHLVQKLSSRPPRIWAHTTQHDVSRVVRLRQGQGGKAKGWPMARGDG